VGEWQGYKFLDLGEIDHIDGDHGNNDPKNLRPLCGCCHAKTKTRYPHRGISLPLDVLGFLTPTLINIIKSSKELDGVLNVRNRRIMRGERARVGALVPFPYGDGDSANCNTLLKTFLPARFV